MLTLKIVHDYMRAEDVPFMKFTKVRTSDNHVSWKRESRPPLSEEEEAIIISLPPTTAKTLSTEEKRVWFYHEIDEIKRKAQGAKTIILVERGNFLRDSFEQFKTTVDLDLRGELKIHFIDELAQDAGGLIREWFSIIVEELFSPTLGLFKKSNTKELSYVINEKAVNMQEHFEFAGKVLAKAIFERIPIKGYLNRTILKQILDESLTIADLKEFDEELWKSVEFIMKTKINDGKDLGLTFVVERESKFVELKYQGKEIFVNDKNKEEFCQAFASYYMVQSINMLLQNFLKGFYSLIPKDVITVLDVDELELFLWGTPIIELKDWKANTVYKDYYNEEYDVIKWFWEVLESLTEGQRQNFLQFCTGSTRVPAEGFKGLLSNSGKTCCFCIGPSEFTGPDTSFIVAHTCFNRIELPNYPDKAILEVNLKRILNNPQCANFTFE